MSNETNQNDIISQKDKQHVWHHLTQHAQFDDQDPIVMVSAHGLRITDSKGRELLDATSGGVWVVGVGYGRTSIAQAIYDAVKEVPFFASYIGTAPAAECAEKLLQLLPHMGRVYYSSSGSEANEKGYKMIRQRAYSYNDGKKNKIIFRDRDYHGTTITALSSCSQQQRRDQYGPFTPGFVKMPHCCCYRCPFGKTYPNCEIECAQVLETIVKREDPDTVGGVVLEPVTAGGGVIPPVREYFPIIAEICKRYDLLLQMDEVVCGMGRTGTWCGYMQYDIEPDIVVMAKGLASGYAPLAVTVTTDHVFSLFKTTKLDTVGFFRDISTYSGCTAGPAAAIENMRILQAEKLLDNAKTMGAYLYDQLCALYEKHSIIGQVRGKGLIAGLELVTDRGSKQPVAESTVRQIIQQCFREGVIIGSTNRSLEGFNNTLLIAPALVCTKSDIDSITKIVDRVLTRIEVNT